MPRPELWTRIFALLGALRTLLREAVPELFGTIAGDARAQLVAVTSLVRRYIHVLAAELSLPPLAVGVPKENSKSNSEKLQPRREAPFRLTELISPPKGSSASEGTDTPFIQWALMFEAARRLNAVLATPQKHALRLARLLRKRKGETLKPMPVPGHILRRLPPWTDALLCRLDEEARPEAWAGINTS
ncbi:hypothetical protein HNE_3492 [Hyphomonas neptunium ATCC 15444]|uniref:Uncharacterized protein n=2 Tax=Hyphomonas TaxID=85 RepID=Q0BWI0_HYPNA|nr:MULTISPECIES: hypothetical protein [Hyphomonas]ABI76571.1 hypothetical protein HNE_3492 [Hyphomonas neptunium ATCC 15444]